MSYEDRKPNGPKSLYVPQALPRAPLNDSEPFNIRQNSIGFNLNESLAPEPMSPVSATSNSRLRRKPPPDLDQGQNSGFQDIINGLEDELSNFDFQDNSHLDYDSQADYYSNSESLGSPQRGSLRLSTTSGLASNMASSMSDNPEIITHELSPSPKLQNDYNTDYSNSSPSVLRSSDQPAVPYPLDSPIAPSTSSLSYNDGYGTASNGNSPAFPISSGSFDDSPTQFPVSPNPFNRTGSQTTTSTSKSYQLRPTISTPITNMLQFNSSSNEQFRNSTSSSTSTNTFNNSNPFGSTIITNTSMPPSFNKGHRKSSSLSSILSSPSQKNINLATLKKTMNLKPGEGERSTYVSTLRKNSGTAYNETGPGKWKLPIGIIPIDKRATYTTSNSKYMRMVGGVTQTKAKRGTGVELKHGHLAPRLLAAEVDDGDDLSMKFNTANEQKDAAKAKVDGSSTTTLTEESSTPQNRSSVSSLLVGGSNSLLDSKNGLTRTTTDTSTASVITSTQSKSSPSKRSSISSGSSGSISDVNGFYQHPLYNRYVDEDHDEGEDVFADADFNDANMDNDFKEAPRLVLANPDASDSD